MIFRYFAPEIRMGWKKNSEPSREIIGGMPRSINSQSAGIKGFGHDTRQTAMRQYLGPDNLSVGGFGDAIGEGASGVDVDAPSPICSFCHGEGSVLRRPVSPCLDGSDVLFRQTDLASPTENDVRIFNSRNARSLTTGSISHGVQGFSRVQANHLTIHTMVVTGGDSLVSIERFPMRISQFPQAAQSLGGSIFNGRDVSPVIYDETPTPLGCQIQKASPGTSRGHLVQVHV